MVDSEMSAATAAILTLLASGVPAEALKVDVGPVHVDTHGGVHVGVGGLGADVNANTGVSVDLPGADVDVDLNGNIKLKNPNPPPPSFTPQELLDLGEPTIRLMIGNLVEADRLKLKLRCKEVLANEGSAVAIPALVALCKIVEGRG